MIQIPNPTELDVTIPTLEKANEVRKVYCVNYRDCLDLADMKNWQAFGCSGCSAYTEMTREQKELDLEPLLTLVEAMNQMHKHGNANRRRGVKPGAPKCRLPIIAERMEGDLELTRSLVIA